VGLVGKPDTDSKGVPMDTNFILNPAAIQSAMSKMGWSQEVAEDTARKALDKFSGSDLYTHLVLMGYMD